LHAAAICRVVARRPVDIVDADVTRPVRRNAAFEFRRKGHHAANAGAFIAFADLEEIIGRALAHRHLVDVPADDGGIEGAGGRRVRGHQLAPDELAVGGALGIRGCLQHGFLLRWCGLHCDTSGWGRPVLPKPGSSTVIPVTGTGMAECKWRFHSKSSYLRGSPSPRLRFARRTLSP